MAQEPVAASGEENPTPRSRFEATGIPNLDLLLGGGLAHGSLALILGPPGSGKTTLANQMAFAAAKSGRRALVLTALAEPTSKLIEHLRTFDFFDATIIGDQLQFMSLQQFLAQGLQTTGDEIVAAARQAEAAFVVLDGFRGVRGANVEPQAARQFLYDVGTILSLRGATTVITSEAESRDPMFFPEATAADIIIGLHFSLAGIRSWRRVEIIKMRGGAPLLGLHGMLLDHSGVVVTPRLEARIAANQQPAMLDQASMAQVNQAAPDPSSADETRAAFGIPNLDMLLRGGMVRETSTLLTGSLGTGKTLLALHFALEGIRQGEPTIFLGFRETTAQLQMKVDAFNLGTQWREALAAPNGLTLVRWEPVELPPDVITYHLLNYIDQTGARRLVVDSLVELQRSVIESDGVERLPNFLAALLAMLRQRHVTALFILETAETVSENPAISIDPVGVLAENVLLIQQLVQHRQIDRVFSVIKTRFSAHDATLHQLRIDPVSGIELLGPFERE